MTLSKKYLFAAAALFLIIFLTGCSEAETLADIREEIAAYQLEPLTRARAVANDLHRLRGLEEGLARQYDVPVSRISEYEHELAGLMNAYYSIHFMQKYLDTNDSFTLDDARLNEIASAKPPYSLNFYLDVMEDRENCNSMLKYYQEGLDYARAVLAELAEKKYSMEKEYRLIREKSTLSTERRLKYNFDLLIIKAKLERSYADKTFYENCSKAVQIEVTVLNEKISKLTPLLKTIRENLSFESEDFEAFNAEVYEKIEGLRNTIKTLNEKYDALDRVRRSPNGHDSFSKYWVTTEEKLVECEILLALDIMELWNGACFAWRALEDVITKDFSAKERMLMAAKAEECAVKCGQDRESALADLHMLQRVNDEVLKRFGKDSLLKDPEDVSRRNDFRSNLDRRIERYLSYIVTLRRMSELFGVLVAELKGVEAEERTSGGFDNIVHTNIESILDTEIWNVDDNPITAGKLIAAVITLLIGLLITLLFVRMAKRRYSNGDKVSKHASNLLQNIIFCLGFTISFLFALKVLRISLTAFAFMGGAAAIAVGLGTQKIMGDTLAGILLLFQKKLRIGDEVIIGDKHGIVSEMTLQNTILLCEQSRNMIIPNSKVLESPILNLTLNNSVSRSEVSVSIAYSSDIQEAMSLIRSVLEENPDVLETPPFRVILSDFEDSAIKFTAFFFIDLSKILETTAQGSVRLGILNSFREHGIEIPFPQSEVTLKNDSDKQQPAQPQDRA
ncbi:MAG: mechanosensitive ion channel [Synergistes sp.]|nr:mechanosensitive ion channel [Synergistes sp.]